MPRNFVAFFRQLFKLLKQLQVVVVISASSKNNCVQFIVLLLSSKNKSAIKTRLLFIKNSLSKIFAIFLFYARKYQKIHGIFFIKIYVHSLYFIRRKKMKEILLDRKLQTMINDYVPSGEILDDLVCFFSMFSDYTRLKIISSLAVTEMCVSDLSNLLKLNQTTVSHQLRLLKNLNAVKTKRQGKVVFYSLRNDLISDVLLKGVEYLGY